MSPSIGLQLYTLRESLVHDVAGGLRRVAEIGYQGVETAFFDPRVEPAATARMLRDLGLTIFATHAPLPLGAGQEEALRLADTLGCRRIVWHGWPEDPRYSSRDGIAALADEYNQAAAVAAAHGLELGLHNHWWEMRRTDGLLPYQALLEMIDPAIFFELDTYWTQVAGLSPIDVLAQLGPRAPLIHIKDGAATAAQPKPMAALGDGALDIPAIVQAATYAEWLVVELDEVAGDMDTAIDRSFRYLSQLDGRDQ
jgi:sugar phosphate isomerase/epimerase